MVTAHGTGDQDLNWWSGGHDLVHKQEKAEVSQQKAKNEDFYKRNKILYNPDTHIRNEQSMASMVTQNQNVAQKYTFLSQMPQIDLQRVCKDRVDLPPSLSNSLPWGSRQSMRYTAQESSVLNCHFVNKTSFHQYNTRAPECFCIINSADALRNVIHNINQKVVSIVR